MGGIGFEPTTFPMSTECSRPAELTTQKDFCKAMLERFISDMAPHITKQVKSNITNAFFITSLNKYDLFSFLERLLDNEKQVVYTFFFVRTGGLEPPCPKAPPPQDGVYTSFTTCAEMLAALYFSFSQNSPI